MIFIAKVVNSYHTEDNIDNGLFTGKIQIRISPLFDDILDEDLPFARPINGLSNSFENVLKDDLVYIYSADDKTFHDLYYFGVVNKTIDFSILLSNIDSINESLEDTQLKGLNEYDLNNYNIKIMCYGNSLFIMNGEENFTLLANKENGNIIYIDNNKIMLKQSDTKIELNSTGLKVSANDKSELNIRKDGTISIISDGDIVINSGNISLGKGTGYIVTSPSTTPGATQSGMTLIPISTIKAG
jgi:hypothetical protein